MIVVLKPEAPPEVAIELLDRISALGLKPLHLPFVIHPLQKLLKHKLVLLLNYLLGTNEGNNAIPLRRNLLVFVQIIYTFAIFLLRQCRCGGHVYIWLHN